MPDHKGIFFLLLIFQRYSFIDSLTVKAVDYMAFLFKEILSHSDLSYCTLRETDVTFPSSLCRSQVIVLFIVPRHRL